MIQRVRNLRELAQFEDSISYLYVEHAVIERKDSAVAFYSEAGETQIPAAGLGVLMIGPGSRITHAAMLILADCGVSIVWVGEDGCRFYAGGVGKSRSSRRLLTQAYLWADEEKRMLIIRRLYTMRFMVAPSPKLTLQQIRGMEGARVRVAYANASREWGVEWHGRNYDKGNWKTADPVNRAISSGAAILYGICHAGIVSMGYSPGIGFIHIGKQLSFVYDVADLYKAEILIPAAFRAASENPAHVEKEVRARLREQIVEDNLMRRISQDLTAIFADIPIGGSVGSFLSDEESGFSEEAENKLWDVEGIVAGGKNYGSDDT